MQFFIKKTKFIIKSVESSSIETRAQLYKKISEIKKFVNNKPQIFEFENIDKFFNFSEYEYKKNKEAVFDNFSKKRN